MTKALSVDIHEWRIGFERGFRKWSVHPEAESPKDLRARLSKLNMRFETTLNSIGNRKVSAEESRNFYQLLGSFQCLSQAVIAYVDTANNIDWVQWREERF